MADDRFGDPVIKGINTNAKCWRLLEYEEHLDQPTGVFSPTEPWVLLHDGDAAILWHDRPGCRKHAFYPRKLDALLPTAFICKQRTQRGSIHGQSIGTRNIRLRVHSQSEGMHKLLYLQPSLWGRSWTKSRQYIQQSVYEVESLGSRLQWRKNRSGLASLVLGEQSRRSFITVPIYQFSKSKVETAQMAAWIAWGPTVLYCSLIQPMRGLLSPRLWSSVFA